jgi:2-hydroxy-6-oxonona-2,4-dienedioate hydrolase
MFGMNSRFPKLAMHIAGHGHPVVLLHGGHGSWTHWARNTEALAEHFQVVAFDLPGYGASPDVPDDLGLDEYVAWVAQAVASVASQGNRDQGNHDQGNHDQGNRDRDERGKDGLDLVGFSFGGALSARVAVRLGAAVRRVSLLGPSGFGTPNLIEIAKLPQRGDSRRPAVAAANLGAWMMSRSPAPDDAVVGIQLANIDGTRFDSRRISRQITMLADLPRIAASVQIIWGAQDKLPVPSIAARADACRQVRPDARISVVPNGGHWVQYEQCDVVNRLLIAFHRRQ